MQTPAASLLATLVASDPSVVTARLASAGALSLVVEALSLPPGKDPNRENAGPRTQPLPQPLPPSIALLHGLSFLRMAAAGKEAGGGGEAGEVMAAGALPLAMRAAAAAAASHWPGAGPKAEAEAEAVSPAAEPSERVVGQRKDEVALMAATLCEALLLAGELAQGAQGGAGAVVAAGAVHAAAEALVGACASATTVQLQADAAAGAGEELQAAAESAVRVADASLALLLAVMDPREGAGSG